MVSMYIYVSLLKGLDFELVVSLDPFKLGGVRVDHLDPRVHSLQMLV